MALLPGTPIGKYVVRRKLAEGGMAEIYLCTSRGPEGFEKEVAIKRVKSFLLEDPGFVKMFVAEARVASKLNHANVVHIFDFDKHDDSYYLAMEYVRGQSLWSLRKRAAEAMRPVSPILVAQIAAEVARGLDHAHRLTEQGKPLGIVHRDVTPHNVLISYEGAVKLTDFGIAKAGDGTTAPGILKGKFAYMSPEQARGEQVDARTDVFALGVVMWELLTGGRLFEGEGEVAVLKAVQERIIPPPARLNPDVPGALDAAVMKALERDLEKRHASAGDLERALSRFLISAPASIEDRDLGAYVRALFPDEAVARELSVPEATRTEPPVAEQSKVEGDGPSDTTYVLPGRRGSRPPATRPSGRAGAAAIVCLGLGLAVGIWRLAARPSVPPPLPPLASVPVAPVAAPVADTPSTLSSSTPGLSSGVAPPAASTPQPSSLPPSPSAAAASGSRKSAGARTERGIVRVKIKPWGTIYLDGRLLGEASPELRAEVPAGLHRLTVKHQDTWKRDVTVDVRPGSELYREWTIPASERR